MSRALLVVALCLVAVATVQSAGLHLGFLNGQLGRCGPKTVGTYFAFGSHECPCVKGRFGWGFYVDFTRCRDTPAPTEPPTQPEPSTEGPQVPEPSTGAPQQPEPSTEAPQQPEPQPEPTGEPQQPEPQPEPTGEPQQPEPQPEPTGEPQQPEPQPEPTAEP